MCPPFRARRSAIPLQRGDRDPPHRSHLKTPTDSMIPVPVPHERDRRSCDAAPASFSGLPVQLAVKPGLCQLPIATDGPDGYVEDLCGLFQIQSSKEPQLDDPALAWVQLLEHLQR